MKKVAFHTLGCRVNQYESEAVLELFLQAGYQPGDFSKPCDVYVINTCSVTAESDKKSRQMIRRARRINPEAVVAVMGCFSQLHPDALLQDGLADVVIGTKNRAQIVELVEKAAQARGSGPFAGSFEEPERFEPLTISTYEGRTRAFLKIQEGCRQFCSYCVIPYARGRLKSRPQDDVVQEAQRLAAHGFREIVLTGIHLASYGRDTVAESAPSEGGSPLAALLSRLDRVTGIDRVRLGSLEPNVMDYAFVSALPGFQKLCPHFHISLQSGCDATLARMNRRYTGEQYQAFVEAIRRALPDVALTTDVMVGFPGETDAEFEASCRLIESIGFAHIHTFIYSKRPGTPAASMKGQVPPQVQKERSCRMLAIGAQSRQAFLQRQVGSRQEVLLERLRPNGFWEGFTRNYLKVLLPDGGQTRNTLCAVRITGLEGDDLRAEAVTG